MNENGDRVYTLKVSTKFQPSLFLWYTVYIHVYCIDLHVQVLFTLFAFLLCVNRLSAVHKLQNRCSEVHTTVEQPFPSSSNTRTIIPQFIQLWSCRSTVPPTPEQPFHNSYNSRTAIPQLLQDQNNRSAVHITPQPPPQFLQLQNNCYAVHTTLEQLLCSSYNSGITVPQFIQLQY